MSLTNVLVPNYTLAHRSTPLPRGRSSRSVQAVPRLMEFLVTALGFPAKSALPATCSGVHDANSGNNTTVNFLDEIVHVKVINYTSTRCAVTIRTF